VRSFIAENPEMAAAMLGGTVGAIAAGISPAAAAVVGATTGVVGQTLVRKQALGRRYGRTHRAGTCACGRPIESTRAPFGETRSAGCDRCIREHWRARPVDEMLAAQNAPTQRVPKLTMRQQIELDRERGGHAR